MPDQQTVRIPRPADQTLAWRTIRGERKLGRLPPGVPSQLAFRYAVHGLELQLEAHVLGRHLPEATISRRRDVEFWSTDHSLWQTVKAVYGDRWWLRWLVSRYPVQRRRCVQAIEFVAHWPQMMVFPWQTAYLPSDAVLGEPARIVDPPYVTVTSLD